MVFLWGRSGSQPNLENVERRPSLQSAQSDSNLQTGTLSTCFIHITPVLMYAHQCGVEKGKTNGLLCIKATCKRKTSDTSLENAEKTQDGCGS